jgi:ectonucleotide pyrophosphatase/phosphodiesterase family protein 5
MDWYAKVDKLIEIFINDNRTNLGVLYFVEPDEIGHEFGPYSNETRFVLQKCDQIVGYLIKRLKEVDLFDYANIIITSDHGMDTASLENSIDLNDSVNISTFKAYGGLTYINIFPNASKTFS